MMKAGGEVIIVADSTKFGRQSLAQMCELSEVDKLVVDHEISPAWQQRVQDAGVELLIAPAEMAILDRPISHKAS